MTTNNVPTDTDLLGCAGVSRLHGNTPAIFGTADIRRFAECVLKNWGQPAIPADAAGLRTQLEWIVRYAEQSLKTNSKDTDDWKGDMQHIANSARRRIEGE